MIFFTKKRTHFFILFFLCSLISGFEMLHAQTNQCPTCWVPVTRHRLVPNVYISPQIGGYIEFLPAGYNPNGSQRYPLIISIPGRGTRGPGTSNDWLCFVACEGLALKVEQENWPPGSGNYNFNTSVVSNGQTYSFIILTPQYNYPDGSPGDVQAMVNFALANYKVDPSRVYLTGLSSGANMVMGYMGSAQDARKIAAVASVGLCMGASTIAAENMGANRIHYWGLVGANDGQCGTTNTITQSTLTNTFSPPGNPMGKYTLVNGPNPDPHIIWPDIHDKNWRVDGKNMAEWFIQFTSSATGPLPATLAGYSVSSRNKQVITEWTTTVESNTDYFSIERAGADMEFKEIGRVTAAGNSSVSVTYSYVDPQPLRGTSFYRLSLMNRDGIREYYDIKKISNKQFGAVIALSPVPANKSLQLSFELEEAQKLNLGIRDINGRLLKSWSGNYSSGFGSFPINIEALAPGVYHLTVQGKSFTETKKFIKQ